MWERRLLSAMITAFATAVVALLGVGGYAVFLAIAVIVPVAMFAGYGAETWIDARRHRSLG